MDRGKPLLTDGNRVRFELVRGDALWCKALLLEQLADILGAVANLRR